MDHQQDQMKCLLQQGFTKGMARALMTDRKAFDHRVWILDNSGSMVIGDGHRIVQSSSGKVIPQTVTRWEELQQTVLYHAGVASILGLPTHFRMLNDPGDGLQQDFSVAMASMQNPEQFQDGGSSNRRLQGEEMRLARRIMLQAKPTGATPLAIHIRSIEEEIREIMLDDLTAQGKRVAVIIATDGLPTDPDGNESEEVLAEFVTALKRLEDLPVWIVIRLCTDEKNVTDYYNGLDGLLELSLEVIDDHASEAKEVAKHNKWLNYALPLHRCRELGYHDQLFDLLDERRIELIELQKFCSLLFGTDTDRIPDPVTDWKEFLKYVDDEQKMHQQEQYDVMKRRMGPWINVSTLNRTYSKGQCTIM